MKIPYLSIPNHHLKEKLLEEKQVLYILMGRNPEIAEARLIEYGRRTIKFWRFLRYKQMLHIDNIRKKNGLSEVFNLQQNK